jgi:hypothetical protein
MGVASRTSRWKSAKVLLMGGLVRKDRRRLRRANIERG